MISAHKHEKKGLHLVLYVSIHSLCPPPPPLNFWVQKDRYEALILAQLQKSNRAGMKSYGLAPNDNKIHYRCTKNAYKYSSRSIRYLRADRASSRLTCYYNYSKEVYILLRTVIIL